jgi:AcrR family transcriptional regulator
MAVSRRRERERTRHRREILAAALVLFSEKGYADTTMAEIAAKAEFAVGTLYRFYPDKDALYRALILETAQGIADDLFAALDAPGDEIERLERYLETKARHFVQHARAARLYFSHMAIATYFPALGVDREVVAMYAGIQERLEAIFAAGVEKGLLAPLDSRALTLGFEGLSNAFLPALLERPEEFSAEAMAAALKRMFFEAMRVRPADTARA